ncbi:YraN family protein [Paenibacillus sp. MMS18-CY102]|uniref:YraN family protein n=1 Tax=Paenibacillus sp. MMS18-CY102 TaxID=2682849 RepID=UPI0013667F69|nr:YraN family protein [Paenibacillus sp. MMS18-CY102]MWC26584.1 YraN family protein [Paenibacillus sp. MMS18-CY102]
MSRIETGKIGEEAAEKYLSEAGYLIRERNWRCRAGEVDIIAEQDGTMVVIEVRTRRSRSSAAFGSAAESVDFRKCQKIRLVTEVYLQTQKQSGRTVRFDVITVLLGADRNLIDLTHIRDAF